MADNVTTQSSTLATIPASTKISTDEDATNGHVQRMKLAVSADGSSTHIGADANGLQVQGAAADASAVTGNPVLIGGDDGTNAVNIAVDSDGAVHISDGSNSITTDNAGTFAVQEDGAALTALQLIDDIVHVDDTATHATGTTKGAAIMAAATPTDGSVDANDLGVVAMSVDRRLHVDAQIVGTDAALDVSGATVTVDNGGTFAVQAAVDNAHSADFDTGAGTDTTIAVGIAVPASGGAAVVPGDATAGLKVDLGADNDVTVSGTVTVTDDGSFTLAANDGVDIGNVDVASVIPGTGATNLGKAIDTAAGATDTGIAALAVRDDALTTLTPVDGDYVPLRVNSTGALHVTGAGGGTQYNVDDASPTVVTMAGAVRDDTLTTLTEADGDATVLRVSSTGALHVTGGGGGTEYTDDTSTHATGSSVGNLMMAAATPTDGSVDANDIGAVAMSTDRRLHVDAQIVGTDAALDVSAATVTVDNAGTFATQVDGDALTALQLIDDVVHVDDTATHATGTTKGALIMAAATPTDGSVDANDIGAVAMSVDRRLLVDSQIVGQDADVNIADGGNSITVDNGGTFAVQAAVDNAHSADFDTGAGTDTTTAFGIAVPASGGAAVVPGDATAGLKVDLGADNDVVVSGTVTANAGTGTFTVDTELPAAATMGDAAANGSTTNVGARNMVFNGTTWDRQRGNTTGAFVHGGTAHDAADAGNPVKVGGKAYNFDGTAPGTAVAEDDRANFITDVYGRQFVETAHPNLWTANAVYTAAQTDTSVKAAPGAGLSLFITDVIVSTDTAFNCFFEHGTTKIIGTLYLAANGGMTTNFRTPIKLPANTALTFTSSATANHSITVNGYIGP